MNNNVLNSLRGFYGKFHTLNINGLKLYISYSSIIAFETDADRFISEKLRGGIYEDWSCNYYSPVPKKITTEVKRIFRHSVANKQINMLYREPGFTKGIINNPKIYGEGTWIGKKLMFKRWLKLDLIDKICIAFYFILSKAGDLRAILLFKKLGIKNTAYNINYWKVQR